MEKDNISSKPFYLQKSFRKVHFLIFMSVAGIVVILVLLNKITVTAEGIKTARQGSNGVLQADYAFIESELTHYQEQMENLKNLIADESEVLVFLQEVDRLRREGVVETFDVLSERPIQDTTGNFGIPVSIRIRGNEEQLDAALRGIQSQPYILRGVQAEITKEVSEEGVETLVLDYGGFLYAEED